MNRQTVLDNLTRTIQGKEQYLKSIKENSLDASILGFMALGGIVQMLEINIDELNRIKQDVECITEL